MIGPLAGALKEKQAVEVSLVSTVLNDTHCISETISSLDPQIGNGREWILTDAGSTDGSWELIERYAKSTQNVTAVRVVPTERLNRGQGRNLGAWLARGKTLIHAIDTDVVYRPGAIDLILRTFEACGRTAIAGDSFFVVSREHFWAVGGYPEQQVEEDFALYRKIKEAGIGFITRRLNIWQSDFQDVRGPLRNLAPFGSDIDKTAPFR